LYVEGLKSTVTNGLLCRLPENTTEIWNKKIKADHVIVFGVFLWFTLAQWNSAPLCPSGYIDG
jgi:hypothetical protein